MRMLLEKQFAPQMLELRDESSTHAGHAGARPEGETHFRLTLVSDAFTGRSRLERQRMVNAILHEEFDTGLHALTLDLKTPEEVRRT